MSIKKPTAEFLANQPYLYRAFERGFAKIEVYDLHLDNWPTDAHFIVDGKERVDNDWWYSIREDQTDETTGERFTVLTFHDGMSGADRPGYLGTHNVQLVVGGEIVRSMFLTIIQWSDPVIEVESEEEINGDLVRITFKLVWPDATPKVMSVVPADEFMYMSWEYNGPLSGYIANEFKVQHDVKTRTTRVSGVTYRFMESNVISLKVGAECITGVKDTGNIYADSIDKRPVALFYKRGDYGEIAPRTRSGLSMGAGCEIAGNKAVAVGGTRNGMMPYFGMVKLTFDGNQPHDGNNYIRIFGCFNAHGRAGQFPSKYPDFDACGHLWTTDLTSSAPSACLSRKDNTPRIHPQVVINGDTVTWGHGDISIPWILADYTDYLYIQQGTTALNFKTVTSRIADAKPQNSCREVWENKGDVIGRHSIYTSEKDQEGLDFTAITVTTLPDGSTVTSFDNGVTEDKRIGVTTISAPGKQITIPMFTKVYNTNMYRPGRTEPGDDIVASGGF